MQTDSTLKKSPLGDLGVLPQLRFPEFEGEWFLNKVGEIFYVNAGGDIDKIHVSKRKTEVFQYPIYANASENKGFYAYSDIFKVEPPVITVAGRGVYIGIAHARNHKFYPIVRLLVLKPKRVQNIYFFEYRINRINLFVESTGVPQLTAPQISSYKIRFPQIEEQTRIAHFLTTIDKRISLLQKKKIQLEQYKKGIMQKLFSQTIRFKKDDGSDFADWKEKKLGELYSFKTTNSYSRDKLNYEVPNVKNIHYGDIHTKFNSHFDITNENVPFINLDVDIDKISYENFLQEGDLVIADASENYPDIGKTIEVINLNEEKVLAGLHTFLARRKDFELAIGFVSHLFKTNSVRLDIMRIAQGTKVLSISTKRLSEIVVRIPCLPEQKKIASFLSSIDTSIDKLQLTIDNSHLFKKGLLQKMFV